MKPDVPPTQTTIPTRATAPQFSILTGLFLLMELFFLILSSPPSACGCASEERSAVGAIMRSQQAHYLEQGQFANSLLALQLGMLGETERNQYFIETTAQSAIAYNRPQEPKQDTFVSAVFVLDQSTPETEDDVMVTAICRPVSPKNQDWMMPHLGDGVVQCGKGTARIVNLESE